MEYPLFLEDFLYVFVDPQETDPMNGFSVNKTFQLYCHQEIDGRETMDLLEYLGVREPHLYIANQFEVMEVAMSRCS